MVMRRVFLRIAPAGALSRRGTLLRLGCRAQECGLVRQLSSLPPTPISITSEAAANKKEIPASKSRFAVNPCAMSHNLPPPFCYSLTPPAPSSFHEKNFVGNSGKSISPNLHTNFTSIIEHHMYIVHTYSATKSSVSFPMLFLSLSPSLFNLSLDSHLHHDRKSNHCALR